jgi:hypothetical protein
MSLAARTVSSPAKGEKWQTVLLIEIQVGNATPFSIFFFEFLNMSAVCLPPQTHCSGILRNEFFNSCIEESTTQMNSFYGFDDLQKIWNNFFFNLKVAAQHCGIPRLIGQQSKRKGSE